MQIKNIILTLTSSLKNQDLNSVSFFQELSSFAKEKKISLYLVTGLNKEVGKNLVIKNKLTSFFSSKNIFHVSENYLKSLSEIDQEIRREKYLLSKEYVDEYFKIYFLNNIKPKLNTEKTLVIGEDVWLDAYYVVEYSKANVLLIKPKITFNKESFDSNLKTINSVSLDFKELKNSFETKQTFDYTKLKSFAKNYLMNKSIGKINLNIDYEKLYKKKEK